LVFVPLELARELVRLCLGERPREACGALVGRRTAHGFRLHGLRPGPNLHPRPHGGFELDPGAVLAAEHEARAAGLERIGFFHSHPAGPPTPSRADREGAWPAELALIVGLDSSGRIRTRAYRTSRDGWHALAFVPIHGGSGKGFA
jgi:desampylase